MEKKKSSWGGRRVGAGRKASGNPRTETITLRVSSALKSGLRQQADAEGKSIGRLVEEMFAEKRKAGE